MSTDGSGGVDFGLPRGVSLESDPTEVSGGAAHILPVVSWSRILGSGSQLSVSGHLKPYCCIMGEQLRLASMQTSLQGRSSPLQPSSWQMGVYMAQRKNLRCL